MVNYQTERIDLLFHALSDGTRRAMLTQLSKRECTVSELAKPHNQTLAGISKHLRVLETADLVRKTKSGREVTCKANLKPLGDVCAVLEALGGYWQSRLDALEELLSNQTEESEDRHGSSTANTERARNRKKNDKSRSGKGI